MTRARTRTAPARSAPRSEHERDARRGILMAEVCTLDWHIAPFRADRWLDLWEPVAARMPSYGATSWSLTRSIDDPLRFHQSSTWESRADFERWWFSDEVERARTAIVDLHDLPILPAWHTLVVSRVAPGRRQPAAQRASVRPARRAAPEVLGGLAQARPDDRLAGVVDRSASPGPRTVTPRRRRGLGDCRRCSGCRAAIIVRPASLELVPEAFSIVCRLARAAPDDRQAGVVDLFGEPVALVEADPGNHPGKGLGDVLEGVVVVVADDHAPVAAQPGARSGDARLLDRRG